MAHEDNSTSLSNLGVWLSMLGRNSAMGVALRHVMTCAPLRSTWRARVSAASRQNMLVSF